MGESRQTGKGLFYSRRTTFLVGGMFVLLQVGYLAAVPPWMGPDEEEHRKYLQALADTGRLPIIAARFAPGEQRLETPQAQQPPLYYLLLAPLYRLVRETGPRGSCWILRSLSILFGLLTVLLTVRLAARLFPANPLLRHGLPALVAFLPTFGHIHGLVNNETLATLLGTLVFFLLLQPSLGRYESAALGLVLGLAALTKMTGLAWLPPALIALVWRHRAQRENLPPLLGRLGVVLGVFLVVSGPWWRHAVTTYGTLFPRAHHRPTVSEEAWFMLFSRLGLQMVGTFTLDIVLSTWYPLWLLRKMVNFPFLNAAVLGGLGVVSWSGLIWHLRRVRKGQAQPRWELPLAVTVGALATGGCFLGVLGQCVFVDHIVSFYGGRYMIAVTPAFMLLFLLGFSAFVRRPKARLWGARLVIGLALLIDLAVLGGVAYFYRTF